MTSRVAALLVLCVAIGACRKEVAPTWRADCLPLVRPAPLSREAACEAYRSAARRHELRLREAAAPGSFLREMHAALDVQRVAAGDVCLGSSRISGSSSSSTSTTSRTGSGAATRRPRRPGRSVASTPASSGSGTISCPRVTGWAARTEQARRRTRRSSQGTATTPRAATGGTRRPWWLSASSRRWPPR
jgi:hypothetical protein